MITSPPQVRDDMIPGSALATGSLFCCRGREVGRFGVRLWKPEVPSVLRPNRGPLHAEGHVRAFRGCFSNATARACSCRRRPDEGGSRRYPPPKKWGREGLNSENNPDGSDDVPTSPQVIQERRRMRGAWISGRRASYPIFLLIFPIFFGALVGRAD